jgi:hypothetical protein
VARPTGELEDEAQPSVRLQGFEIEHRTSLVKQQAGRTARQ